MDIDFIIRFENGEATEDEIIENFQKGINDGSVWKLQGFYGRTAKALIDQGLCNYASDRTYDYYGSPIPTQQEMGN